jgi:hypothetical protein
MSANVPCPIDPVQVNVRHQRRNHAPNAMGNFCFEVTLGYRRLELPRRGERPV